MNLNVLVLAISGRNDRKAVVVELTRALPLSSSATTSSPILEDAIAPLSPSTPLSSSTPLKQIERLSVRFFVIDYPLFF